MFIVMSAIDHAVSGNRARCYELNAVDIVTEAEAQRIADERNAAERAAGHDNVFWYPCPDMLRELRS